MRKHRGRTAVTPRRVIGAVLVVLLLGGWWLFLRPAALGGSTTLVSVSGQSMEPGMHTGDLAIVRKGGDYLPGDVIAYRVPREDDAHGRVVIHRIVDGDAESGFRMRGDNNDFFDPWRPTRDDITGELLWHVPGGGRVVMAMADPVIAGGFFAALTAFLVVAGGGRRDDPVAGDDRDQHEVSP